MSRNAEDGVEDARVDEGWAAAAEVDRRICRGEGLILVSLVLSVGARWYWESRLLGDRDLSGTGSSDNEASSPERFRLHTFFSNRWRRRGMRRRGGKTFSTRAYITCHSSTVLNVESAARKYPVGLGGSES